MSKILAIDYGTKKVGVAISDESRKIAFSLKTVLNSQIFPFLSELMSHAWTMFSPSFIDIGIFLGTIGFFFVLFLMYARTFPVVAQAELKTILKSSGSEYKARSHE